MSCRVLIATALVLCSLLSAAQAQELLPSDRVDSYDSRFAGVETAYGTSGSGIRLRGFGNFPIWNHLSFAGAISLSSTIQEADEWSFDYPQGLLRYEVLHGRRQLSFHLGGVYPVSPAGVEALAIQARAGADYPSERGLHDARLGWIRMGAAFTMQFESWLLSTSSTVDEPIGIRHVDAIVRAHVASVVKINGRLQGTLELDAAAPSRAFFTTGTQFWLGGKVGIVLRAQRFRWTLQVGYSIRGEATPTVALRATTTW
jgi:hypothetical protein